MWFPFATHEGLAARVEGWLAKVRARVRFGALCPQQQGDLCLLLDEMRLVKDAHEIGLMREAGVQFKHRKKYKVTTNSNHKQPVFENKLNRQFDVEAPNQVYVGDITYIWTQEGWLYLAVVIDFFSRKVVGWSMNSRMKARLVCDALRMAIWQRQPQAGLIVHSDRGSQGGFNRSSQQWVVE